MPGPEIKDYAVNCDYIESCGQPELPGVKAYFRRGGGRHLCAWACIVNRHSDWHHQMYVSKQGCPPTLNINAFQLKMS